MYSMLVLLGSCQQFVSGAIETVPEACPGVGFARGFCCENSSLPPWCPKEVDGGSPRANEFDLLINAWDMRASLVSSTTDRKRGNGAAVGDHGVAHHGERLLA